MLKLHEEADFSPWRFCFAGGFDENARGAGCYASHGVFLRRRP